MSDVVERAKTSVLVLESQALGMIAVIRSLGLSGYRVHAVSSRSDALGIRSRYCDKTAIHPEYRSRDFIPWLKDYIENNAIKVIVPSEGFLHACGDCYERVKSLIPDAVSREVWECCMSKLQAHSTLTRTSETSTNLPPTTVVRNVGDIPPMSEVDSYSGPFYVKADSQLSKKPDVGARVVRCDDYEKLRVTLLELLGDYKAVIYQRHVHGTKVGVSLWRHHGKILAENMTLGIHMNPWRGGMMSLRKTFWNEKLLDDAKRKMAALDWQGVAMMEYTWNPEDDSFHFIEINARYWGYLHLDLYSGKDFPLLQVDAFFGRCRSMLGPPEKKLACRYAIPGETGYLLSRLSSEDLPVAAKLKSVAGFFVRFANPFTRADLLFPGDRLLYWIQAWRFVADTFKSRFERFPRFLKADLSSVSRSK